MKNVKCQQIYNIPEQYAMAIIIHHDVLDWTYLRHYTVLQYKDKHQ